MANVMATGAQAVVASNPGCSMQLAFGARRIHAPLQQVHIVDLLDRAYGHA
jgi:Fe-S oxidoreductase